MKKIQLFILLSIVCSTYSYSQQKFIWGVASASYQVEGAYQADGKGESNWDAYTNKYEMTIAFTGTTQNANVSANQYERKQYLKDFALMKELGVTHYRISLSWARILPNGTGKINQKGLDHYSKFIDDLLSFGIEPCVTLYHWDMPQVLQEKGGFSNPKFIDWYINYSNIVFKALGKKVKCWITFNEPQIDLYLLTNMANNVIAKKENPMAITSEQIATQAQAAHHLLLASAKVINNYHKLGLGGQIGITYNLIPTIPKDVNNPDDVTAARLQDGIHNKFFLDGALKGTYPKEIVALFKKYNPSFKNTAAEMNVLKSSKPDFIGVNYYSPAYVSKDEKFAFGINWFTNNPDSIKMFNGVVKPEYLYKLLMRIKNEYNNIPSIITENGAGFGDIDEQIVDGKIDDKLRCDYIKKHIAIALKAKKDGANLQGYMLWSILDNFEWAWGFDKRFGIVNVNFETQKRTPKNSFYFFV